ncbi:MAG: DNA mismatch repair endonuclease MutL [Spirochaetales bacterium]|nr:DNA mismatch repair endonuclease MutL [Spirochaetales bacterium]MDY5915971.1 DNA mismatch repair endonuclease MutL [Treponema sp.]
MSLKNPVKKLDAEVARKIAAGEVIDRPNAIVRELMDNSIDSGAKTITVEISGGGIEKIRIVDDGCGMTKEDLQNCARPHATSKISSEIDLLNLTTLGFRGEALSSIAAVSRLSIISGGWKMRASITEDHILEPQANITGTIVQSEGLFENFPARRQFLKRPATEALMCKNTFIEKTLAHPEIAFRFIQDGEIKIDLPQNQSLKERFVMANGLLQYEELFFEISKKSSFSSENCEWSFDVIIGEPAVSRPSKKDIEIFANGRKIQEYSLVQAVEYGCQGFFPNGTYPVAGVFVHVRPDLIDFNIHPAKKEARFYDISDLHHGLSSTIKDFFKKYTYANFSEDKSPDEIRSQDFFDIYSDNIENQTGTKNTYASIHYKTSETNNAQLSDFLSKYLGIKSQNSQNQSQNSYLSRTKLYDIAQQALDAQNPQSDELNQNLEKKEYDSNDFQNQFSSGETFEQNQQIKIEEKIKFIGTCLGTFLLAEKNNCLYIIDQHAAHERILFDRLMNNQDENANQQLLIPYKIRTESKTQDLQLEKLQSRLSQIGFEIQKIEDGYWEVTSIPERWTGSEFDLKQALFVKHVEPEEIIRSIAAMTACKAAVKDGYILDPITAEKLVKQAFTLEDPHCPHGRPIYTVISREKLFELVKRT